MPALPARGTGIHVQAMKGIIVHDLKDMRMPADKKLNIIFHDILFYAGSVAPGIAADMLYEYIHSFAGKEQLFRVQVSDILPVNVPVNTTENNATPHPGNEGISDLFCAEIAAVPNFITVLKMFENRFVEEMMGV